jgi:hypothetical protein
VTTKRQSFCSLRQISLKRRRPRNERKTPLPILCVRHLLGRTSKPGCPVLDSGRGEEAKILKLRSVKFRGGAAKGTN